MQSVYKAINGRNEVVAKNELSKLSITEGGWQWVSSTVVAQQGCSSNQQSEILEISPQISSDVQTEDKAGRDPLSSPFRTNRD